MVLLATTVPSTSFAQDDATPVRLSLDAARQLGLALNNENRPAEARALARELLTQNPEDTTALLILSRAERLLGRPQAAEAAGKSAWRSAETPIERYSAALLTARALTDDGSLLQAQFWLRRATQEAPNDQLKAQTIQEFRAVRQATPISIQLDFSISPSSNVNNGATEDSTGAAIGGFDRGTLSNSSQALTGLDVEGFASVTYKLQRPNNIEHSFTAALDLARVVFSSESKRLLDEDRDAGRDDLSASDLAVDQLSLSYALSQTDEDGRGATSLTPTVSQLNYGGETLTRSVGVTVGRRAFVNDDNLLSLSVSARRDRRFDNELRSADVWSLSAGWTHYLEDRSRISASLFVADTNSDSSAISNFTQGGSLSYTFGQPVFGSVGLQTGVTVRSRKADAQNSLFVRDELGFSGFANFTFTDISYYGFSPSLNITASRTRSDTTRFDTRALGVKLGLRSSF